MLQRTHIEWKKIFANLKSHKGFVCRIYKELLQLDDKKTNAPAKKRAKQQ